MTPIVDTGHVDDGGPGLRLEGDRLRVTVFPDAGANVLDLVVVETGDSVLWQNPRVPLRRINGYAALDEVSCWRGYDPLLTNPCTSASGEQLEKTTRAMVFAGME